MTKRFVPSLLRKVLVGIIVAESLSLAMRSGKRDSAFGVLRQTGQGKEYSILPAATLLFVV